MNKSTLLLVTWLLFVASAYFLLLLLRQRYTPRDYGMVCPRHLAQDDPVVVSLHGVKHGCCCVAIVRQPACGVYVCVSQVSHQLLPYSSRLVQVEELGSHGIGVLPAVFNSHLHVQVLGSLESQIPR